MSNGAAATFHFSMSFTRGKLLAATAMLLTKGKAVRQGDFLMGPANIHHPAAVFVV